MPVKKTRPGATPQDWMSRMRETSQEALQEWMEKSRSSIAFRPDGRLQQIFEERVAAVLARLGVPSRKELQELSAKVDQLLAASGGAAAPAAKRVRKPAAKPAAKPPAKGKRTARS